jgi:hypothetical protein
MVSAVIVDSCSVNGVVTWLLPFESVIVGRNSMELEAEGPVIEIAESVSGDVATGLTGDCASETLLVL